jgi:uncharacterized protein YecT (DUF1311 family)
MTETATPPTPAPDLVSARPAASKRLIYAGLAAAAALGVVLALALSGGGEPKADAGAADGKGLAIAVQPAPKPAPIPVTKSADPLNALPEEAAGLPANPRAPPTASPAPVVTPASTAPETTERPSRANPSFDCDDAGSRAEQMICADRRLAAADRRMDRAFQAARDAGVPMRILRRQQRAFLDARDEAARHGPDAVADVYSERIAELDGMAQGY